jgi:large subunit ribosomal protein L3
MRTGIIAKKLGMTRIFQEDGRSLPVTILSVDSVKVTGNKVIDTDGYTALQLGIGVRKNQRVNKSLKGYYAKSKLEPCQKIVEFRVDNENLVSVGSELSASHFLSGQYVDVTGVSIGKGFAGAMKRHNFGGLEASHGVSISHRSHGSTGQCQDPGKVFKGKKMAGHLGDQRTTIQNLEVVSTDIDRGLIFVHGAVPGARKSYVLIKDAVKKDLSKDLPLPAGLKKVKEEIKTDSKNEESSEEIKDVPDDQKDKKTTNKGEV